MYLAKILLLRTIPAKNGRESGLFSQLQMVENPDAPPATNGLSGGFHRLQMVENVGCSTGYKWLRIWGVPPATNGGKSRGDQPTTNGG